MTPSHCKQVWREGGTALMVLQHLPDPRVSEIAAAVGWDAIWIDLEHSSKTTGDLEMMCRAIRAGSFDSDKPRPDVLARPAKGEWMRMARLLEAGAHGIMYPRCESVDEARQVVRWMKFAPQGERGFDGGNADNRYGGYAAGDYVARANAETWLAAQIESPTALHAVDAIAEVDGVDVVFFGPGDFSCLIGKPGQLMDRQVLDAAKKVSEAARRAKKVFGTIGIGEEHTRAMRDLGAGLLNLGADQGLLKKAMVDLLEHHRRA